MNKEVGKAIYELKTELERNKAGFTSYLAGQFGNDIDTVLNYIEELENRLKEKENIVKKSSLEAQKYFDMLMEVEYGRDTIPKQKVRDKIKELDEMKLDNDDIFGQMRNYAVLVLKELLGE